MLGRAGLLCNMAQPRCGALHSAKVELLLDDPPTTAVLLNWFHGHGGPKLLPWVVPLWNHWHDREVPNNVVGSAVSSTACHCSCIDPDSALEPVLLRRTLRAGHRLKLFLATPSGMATTGHGRSIWIHPQR